MNAERGLRLMFSVFVCLIGAILGLAWTVEVEGCAGWTPQVHMIEPELVTDPKFGSCARTGTTLQAASTQFALLTSVCVQQMGDSGVVIDPPVEQAVLKDAGMVEQ